MPTRQETLQIDGREVVVTNPDKVFFPATGQTKLDLVRYYLAVADGALRGAGGRPIVLVRFVNGAGGEFFFQKRAPENRPAWLETVDALVPVGPHRGRDRPARRRRSRLDGEPRLPRAQSAPGARRRPRPPGRAARRSRPGARRRVVADPRGGAGRARSAGGRRARRLAEDVRLARHPRRRADRAALDVPRGAPRGAGARARRRTAGARRSPRASGGRKNATASSSTTTRTPRTERWRRRTRSGRRRTRACRRRCRWDEVPTVETEAFTLATVPRSSPTIGDRARGHRRRGRLAGGAPRAVRARRGGRARRRAVAAALPQAGGRAAARPAVEAAPGGRRLRHARRPKRNARRTASAWNGGLRGPQRSVGEFAGTHPTPTGRRRSSIPVIEISRAAKKDEALAGLERWKERHPTAAAALDEAGRARRRDARAIDDVVPRPRQPAARAEADRPAQETLDPDYDPWAEYEFPDRSGQLERSRKKPKADATG